MRPILILLCATLLGAADWPASVRVGEADLPLRGSERFSWLWYKVYDVALHVPADSSDVLGSTPRRIAFRYLRAFTAAELAKATSKTAGQRLGSAPKNEVEAGITAINALWPAVVVGDELVLTYVPGTGTSVAHNGRILGNVSGDAFANVLFSVWLGSDPIDDDLRAGLLARR